MENRALALLRNEALWKKVGLTKYEGNHPGLVTNFLLHLITTSQALGGTFLDNFWLNLGKCHPRLQENIGQLNAAPELVSENDVSVMLFKGVPPTKFNFAPVFLLAAEYFTHLGLTFMQPRDIIDEPDPYDEVDYFGDGSDSDVADPCDAYDFAGCSESEIKRLDKLKLDIQEGGLSRDQILKYSAFNRDGFNCVITGLPLQYPQRPHNGVRCDLIYWQNRQRCRPNLTPIIPFLIESPIALRCLTSLAGDSTRQLVLNHLFTVENVMVLSYDARYKFDDMLWAVEGLDSVRYVYRGIPPDQLPGPRHFKLLDGNEVKFGLAQDGRGPLPELCNLRLAVARALSSSGASRLMGMLIDDPDVDTSREFREMAASSFYLQLACNLPKIS